MSEFKKVKLKGVSGVIEVNEDGTIVKYNDKVLKQHNLSKDKDSYRTVNINSKNHYVHRIVAMAFIFNKNPLTHRYVSFVSDDLTNTHYTNLKWATSADLRAKSLKKHTGEEIKYRGSSRIPYEEAVKIAKRLDKGEFAKDICVEYGVSEMSIARIRKRYCKGESASPRYDQKIKSMVFKLLKKYDTAEVAKITGLQYHTIYRWNKNKEKFNVKANFHY